MKNREQANNLNNINDPPVGKDPQAQVEFDDLPISGEQEELVKGGNHQLLPGDLLISNYNVGDSAEGVGRASQWIRVGTISSGGGFG